MTAHTGYVFPSIDVPQLADLRGYIDTHGTIEGRQGALCTPDTLFKLALWQPYVEACDAFHRTIWGVLDVRPVRAWGIRIRDGIALAQHSHPSQRYTVLLYLSHGAPLYVEGERIEIAPGLLVTFKGTAEHWTPEHKGPDRFCLSCSFG